MKENLPVRKKIRLKDYDYSQENMYFITICVKDRIEALGKIREENINLTKEGKIVSENISKLEEIYKNIQIEEYVVMPNHIHIKYSIWQKSFYEHIIRNEKEYLKINEYIKNNVINWQTDKYF